MSALSKVGYAVLWDDASGNTRWSWFKELSAAQNYAAGMAELGLPRPLVFQAQEVKP